MPSITCTNCGAVLKTKDPVPPGKKVKCPKCTQAFVVQADDEPMPISAADDAGPAPKKNPFDLSDDGAPASGGSGGSGEEKSSKKNGKPKKSKTLMIVLIVVGALFLCCCGCGALSAVFQGPIQKAIDDANNKAK